MARKTTASAAKTDDANTQGALALMGNDALGDVLGDLDLGTDGLEELEASDVKLAALVWNFKGVDDNEEPIPPNRFFNTVSEEVTQEEELVLLDLHKSHAYKEFDAAESRNKLRCKSWDRVTGTTEDGVERACKGCPDKQWSRDPETGKRGRKCSDVSNVVALRLADASPVIIRFTRTSEKPWKDYLNKHVIGKRIVNGKRVNMPLFAHPTTVTLQMAKGASNPYAKPVLERGDKPFSRDEIVFFAESAKGFREMQETIRHVAEGAPDDDASDAPSNGSGVNADDFIDGDGDFPGGDFPDADAASASDASTGAAKRF